MQRGAAVGARTEYQQLVGDAVVVHGHVKPSVTVHVTQSNRPSAALPPGKPAAATKLPSLCCSSSSLALSVFDIHDEG